MRRNCAYIQWVQEVFSPLFGASVTLHFLLVRFTQQKATEQGFLVHKSSSALIMLLKMKQPGSNVHHKQARWDFQVKSCIYLCCLIFDLELEQGSGTFFNSKTQFFHKHNFQMRRKLTHLHYFLYCLVLFRVLV